VREILNACVNFNALVGHETIAASDLSP